MDSTSQDRQEAVGRALLDERVRTVAIAAIVLGVAQFYDDGGGMLFRISESVLGGKHAYGWMLIGSGCAAVVAHFYLPMCRELRVLVIAGMTVMWGSIPILYVMARSVRPAMAMAIIFAALSCLALAKLCLDYIKGFRK